MFYHCRAVFLDSLGKGEHAPVEKHLGGTLEVHASLQIIGQALGHRSTASTQIYSQLLSQSVREAQDKSERKMRELMASAAKRERRSRLLNNSWNKKGPRHKGGVTNKEV